MTEDFPPGTPEADVLAAIVAGQCAWTSGLDLVRSFGDAILHHEVPRLLATGWLCRWDRDAHGRPIDPESWTLTPWAAEQLGVELDERPLTEIPYWVKAGTATGPIVQLGEERAVALRHPERVIDPHPGPEYLADLETGDVTTDPAAAVKVLGVPVAIDPRLKPSDTDRPKTRRTASGTAPHRKGPKRPT